jgi:hypothetical protein
MPKTKQNLQIHMQGKGLKGLANQMLQEQRRGVMAPLSQ